MVEMIQKYLKDEIELEYGKGLTRNQRKKGKIPVYGSNGIVDYNDKAYFQGPGIIIGRKGTVGSVKYEKNDFWAIDTTYVVKLKKENEDSIFWYYFLQTLGLEKMNSHSAVPGLNRDRVYNIKINIPKKQEDREKISKILRSFDKKIELNNYINNNLQELILTLFKQFMEDNNDAEEDLLEDCVKKIGTGADAIQRAPIVDYDTGIRCIRVGDMTNNRKCYEWGFTKMTDKDFDNYKLDIGDIVITRTAVNGIAYLIEDSIKVVCNNGLIRLKVNENYNPLYIFLTMKTMDFYNYIHRIDSETSVRPNMKVDYLTSYRIKKILLEKQNKFCDMIKPMRKRQKEIEHENNNLIKLRDTLLPKLMNGEIGLDNIEI